MKIAFFTDDYLPYVHGVTTSIQNYRQALEELGHEVYIVAPRPKTRGFEDNDDHVIRMPSVMSYIFDKRPVSLLYPGIARKLYKYNFDIVHSHTQFYLGVIAGMVAKKQNIPHVTTVHTLFTELLDDYPTAVTAGLIAASIGFPFVYKTRPILPFESAKEILDLSTYEKGEIKKLQGWRLTAACVNQTDVGIAPSAHLAKTLVESGATIPIKVITNGISLERYQNADLLDPPLRKRKNEHFIVSVARISGEKRQKVLIEAMAHMHHKSAKLILVGDGPELKNAKKLAKELQVENRVIFTGLLNQDAVAAILKQSDMFVLASYRFDNQPMSILEAVASELPIVYCDDNLIEGLTAENSQLTDSPEAESFARTFDELLSNEKRLASMSTASKELAETFDRKKLVRQLLKLYDSLRTVQ